jgi:hypothetical protein
MVTQHNAVFYGIETDIDDDTNDIDESLTPRFLGSYIKNANDDYSLWGAGGMDQDGIDNYHFVYSAYDYLRIYYMIKRFIPRLDLGRNLYYHNTYRAFKNGTNFLKDFNSYWKNIIGATSVNIVYDGDCECIIEDQWGEIDYILFDCDDTSFNQQQCDYIHETSNVNIEFKSSDGFILAESAKDAPGMNYEPSFMPGSSHFQMRNDENTRDAMEKIFDNGVNGEFFNTDRR